MLADMQRRMAGSTNFEDDALRRLVKTAKRVELLEKHNRVLMSEPIKVVKARASAITDCVWWPVKVVALPARVCTLCNKLDLLERCKETNWIIEAASREVVSACSRVLAAVENLHRNSVASNAFNCRNLDWSLVNVCNCLEVVFDWEAHIP